MYGKAENWSPVVDILQGIYALPGGEDLSRGLCNWPVNVHTSWIYDRVVAYVTLCGRSQGHVGNCDYSGDQ